MSKSTAETLRANPDVAAAKARVADLYSDLVTQFGPEKANELWADTMTVHKPKRGAPYKTTVPQWDSFMLQIYDLIAGDPNPKTRMREMAKFFVEAMQRRVETGLAVYTSARRAFASAEAVGKRLRRLLKQRDEGKLTRIDRGDFLPGYRRSRDI